MRPRNAQKSKEKVVQDGGLFLGFLKMDIGDIKDKTFPADTFLLISEG